MTQYIPLNILLNYETHGELYILTRLRAVRSLWLNWTYKDLSAALHISHTTLRRHMKSLLRLGWVKIQGSTLICTSIKKLRIATSKNGKTYKSPCVAINQTFNKQDAIIQFRNSIIADNVKKQARQEKVKEQILNSCKMAYGKLSKAAIRKLKLAGGVERFSGSIQVPNLSNKTFGSLIGRSLSTGKLLQKKLKENGLIAATMRFKEVATNVSRLEWLYNYAPTSKGLIYCENSKSVKQRLSNAITIR